MKKRLIFLLIGAIVCMLSACGQRENIEHTQANISNNVISSEGVTDDEEEEITASDNVISSEGVTDDVEKEITASGNVTSSEGVTDDEEEEIAASDNVISSEGVTDDEEEEITASGNVTSSEGVTDDEEEEITAFDNVADDLIVNELEKLAGEYEYLSDYGVGRLIIEKNEYAYDILDYESQSSYRFLADSSNIESIANNRIYIKYPEQVFQDDTVIFCYYILEYGEDEMNVYYRQSEQADEQFLYHATKKN